MRFSRIVLIAACPAFGQSTSQQMSASAAARFLDQATLGPDAGVHRPAATDGDRQLAERAVRVEHIGYSGPAACSIPPASRTATCIRCRRRFFRIRVTGQDQLRQRVAFALSQMWVVSFSGVSDRLRLSALLADLSRQRVWKLSRSDSSRDAQPRHGPLSEHGEQQQGQSGEEHLGQRKLCARADAALHAGPDAVESGWHAGAGSKQQPDPHLRSGRGNEHGQGAYRLDLSHRTRRHGRKTIIPQYFFGQMFAVESEHDTTAKTIFSNITIPAGQTAEQDLNSLLDALMAQPTMAPFVIQAVDSTPGDQQSKPAVHRSGSPACFENDGNGVTGNLQAVITAILTDPEARAGDDPTASVDQPELRPHARAGPVHAESAARPEWRRSPPNSAIYSDTSRNGRESVQRTQRLQLFLAAVSHRKADCSGRSFRSIRRRPRRIAPTSSTRFCMARSTKAHGESDAVRAASRQHQLRCSATSARCSCTVPCRPTLEEAATDAVNAASTPTAQSASRALRRSDFGRVPNHSLRRSAQMTR